MSVLLGIDTPLLLKLQQKTQPVNKIDNALVVTQARAKKELEDELELGNASVEGQLKSPESTLVGERSCTF